MRRGSSSSQQPSAAKEKARRDRMKDLYSTLASLLQLQPHERMPLPDLLERATTTLKQWQERVECLKSRKKELEESLNDKSSNNIHKVQQFVQVREVVESKLEANLKIKVNNKNVTPSHILRVIEEGGTQVTSSNFCHIGHHIFCAIHAQASNARVGFDVEFIESRLLELVY
ncbi:Myc-type, basic helix-loop-helix domain-containing protein [Tanacetum coccineum]